MPNYRPIRCSNRRRARPRRAPRSGSASAAGADARAPACRSSILHHHLWERAARARTCSPSCWGTPAAATICAARSFMQGGEMGNARALGPVAEQLAGRDRVPVDRRRQAVSASGRHWPNPRLRRHHRHGRSHAGREQGLRRSSRSIAPIAGGRFCGVAQPHRLACLARGHDQPRLATARAAAGQPGLCPRARGGSPAFGLPLDVWCLSHAACRTSQRAGARRARFLTVVDRPCRRAARHRPLRRAGRPRCSSRGSSSLPGAGGTAQRLW